MTRESADCSNALLERSGTEQGFHFFMQLFHSNSIIDTFQTYFYVLKKGGYEFSVSFLLSSEGSHTMSQLLV